MKKIYLFLLFMCLLLVTTNAQTFMNVYHSGINSYDTDIIPTVTFTNTDVVLNGVTASFGMSNVSKITFGLATTVNEEIVSSSVNIYPNPTSDFLYFNIKNNKSCVVDIYNVLGSKISTNTFTTNGVEKINLSSYENGIYIIRINIGDIIIKKIVKN